MAEENFQNIKDEKVLKDSENNDNDNDNDNESGNSMELQENNNEELDMGGEPNLDMTNKVENNNNNDDDENKINNNSKEENEDEYIAMIEGLENELLIEQYITNSLKKDPDLNEEINKLKSELNSKNNKLEQLKSINKKQENTLIEFKNKLKKEINKKAMNNKVIINNENNMNLSVKNIKEVSKNEAINNVIKIKDSALINVINKMNFLKKENEELKKKIYQNENNFNCSFNKNSNFEDFSQKNLEKIKFLQNEIKILNKQLLEHNKCIEEQNIINKEYNNLKNELRLLKINNQEIKNKTKEFEKKILNIEINDINNNSIVNYNINNLTLKKNSILNLNISNKRQSSVRNTTFSKTLPKPQKQNLLPIISIQPLMPNACNQFNNQNTYNNNNNNSILSYDFLKKIKNYYNNNETEYFILINKIKNIEANSMNRELKKYNTQFGILDKKKLLNFDGKENEYNLKMMNYRLNTIKDENILQNKKTEELQKHLCNVKNLEKKNDNEIALLLKKISSRKNELKIKEK